MSRIEKCRIIAKKEQVLSPWLTLITRTVEAPHFDSPQDFHSVRPKDYVTMLAVTREDRILLVRQFRPVPEKVSLELPSGLLEAGEDAKKCAVRELEEETGYTVGSDFHFLAEMLPDSGRMENRLWCYYCGDVVPLPEGKWQPEREVERVLLPKEELKRLVLSGEFEHALHIAVIGMAVMQGRFRF